MTFYIYQINPNIEVNVLTSPEYFFITDTLFFSSDFQDLHRLIDVGLDGPGIKDWSARGKQNIIDLIEYVNSMPDVTFLLKTDNLDDIPNEYPEYFI